MKNVVQDLTSGGLLGVWGKWVKHAKYIYNIQDFNPEQVLAVGYTKNDFCGEAAKAVRYDSDFVWEGESWPMQEYILSEKDKNAIKLSELRKF